MESDTQKNHQLSRAELQQEAFSNIVTEIENQFSYEGEKTGISTNHSLAKAGLVISSVTGFVTGMTTGFFFGETIGLITGSVVGSTTGSIIGLTTGFVEGCIEKFIGQQTNYIEIRNYSTKSFLNSGCLGFVGGLTGGITGKQIRISLYQYLKRQLRIRNDYETKLEQIVEEQNDEDEDEEFEIIQIENNKDEDEEFEIIQKENNKDQELNITQIENKIEEEEKQNKITN